MTTSHYIALPSLTLRCISLLYITVHTIMLHYQRYWVLLGERGMSCDPNPSFLTVDSPNIGSERPAIQVIGGNSTVSLS